MRPRRSLPPFLPLLAVQAGLALAGCASPIPNDLVVLDVVGAPRFALSTEDGILALDGDDLGVPEVPLKFWEKSTPVLDDAEVQARTGTLALLKQKSTRLHFAEIAAEGPRPGEDLYIQLMEDDPERLPFLVDAHLYADGEFGDLAEVDDWFTTCNGVARDFAGAGIYVQRQGRYLLVGIVNGTVATNPHPNWFFWLLGPRRLLPFVPLDEIATALPKTSNFFERRIKVFRPDFEYGLERDGSEKPRPR